jgi:hypothetical protein
MPRQSKKKSAGDRDVARVRDELAERLRSRNVDVFDSDTSDQVMDIMDAVEAFENAVEAHGGDLMVDEPPAGRNASPDAPQFVLPRRAPKESPSRYIGRVAAAISRVRAGE